MNVPKLRFKEFNDEWIRDKIGNFVIINSGDSPSKFEFYNQGIPYYKVEQLNNCLKYQVQTPYYINTNKVIPKGSIIFPKRGAAILLNKIRILNLDSFFDTNIMSLTTNGINNEFLYYYLIKENLSNIADTSSIPQLNNKHIEPYPLIYPRSSKEQEMVGKTLQLLDKKIELQTKKIEDLKLFTKKTSKELIKKYTINLEDKYVQDICKIQTGKSNTQDKNENGKYPFYIRSEEITYSDKYIFDCEAVLTIGDGNIGKVYFYKKGKFDCHQRVYVMNNFDQSILGKYFYYYFSNNFYKRAKSMSAKNTVDSVRLEMISKMKIRIPKIVEQQKIVNILSTLDNKILFENNKLKCLISLKKGLMQNMFV